MAGDTGAEVLAMRQARRADLQLRVGDGVSGLPTGRLEALCPSITASAVCSPALKPSGPRCATAHPPSRGARVHSASRSDEAHAAHAALNA